MTVKVTFNQCGKVDLVTVETPGMKHHTGGSCPVVDDEANIVELLSEPKFQALVYTATNGAQALDQPAPGRTR